MAIGATPGQVFALIFRQAFVTVALGLAIGLGATIVCIRSLGLDAGHAGTVVIAAGLVTITAGIACWIPARRATSTDPTSALRRE